jgi:hypothetical protein
MQGEIAGTNLIIKIFFTHGIILSNNLSTLSTAKKLNPFPK